MSDFIQRISNLNTIEQVNGECLSSYYHSIKYLLNYTIIPDVEAIVQKYAELIDIVINYRQYAGNPTLPEILMKQERIFSLAGSDLEVFTEYEELLAMAKKLLSILPGRV